MAQNLKKVSILPEKPVISQKTMQDFAVLKTNYKLLEDRYNTEKEKLLHLLKNPDTKIEDGPLGIFLKETPERRPAWKEIFESVIGKERTQEVIDDTPFSFRKEIKVFHKPTIE